MSSQIDLPEILCNFFAAMWEPGNLGKLRQSPGAGGLTQLFTLAVDTRDWSYLAQFLDDIIYQSELE